MAQQNIYDNEIFFEGYKKIRDNEVNANNLFEMPALFSMMPDLTGKRVLDLGCYVRLCLVQSHFVHNLPHKTLGKY